MTLHQQMNGVALKKINVLFSVHLNLTSALLFCIQVTVISCNGLLDPALYLFTIEKEKQQSQLIANSQLHSLPTDIQTTYIEVLRSRKEANYHNSFILPCNIILEYLGILDTGYFYYSWGHDDRLVIPSVVFHGITYLSLL